MELSISHWRRIAAGTLAAGVVAATAYAATPPSATSSATSSATAPAPAAAAQPCGPRGGMGMDVTKIKERGAKVFAKVDANGDGKITETEFLAAEGPGHGGMGHGMGPGPGMGHGMDHGMGMGMGPGVGMGPGMGMGPNGGPTDAQRQTFEADLFKALDTDGNGQLSPAEFAKAHETMRTMMKKQAFVRFDVNKDGVLTKDEFPPFAKRAAAMDTNNDGKVTPEEMQAAKAAKATPPPPTKPN